MYEETTDEKDEEGNFGPTIVDHRLRGEYRSDGDEEEDDTESDKTTDTEASDDDEDDDDDDDEDDGEDEEVDDAEEGDDDDNDNIEDDYDDIEEGDRSDDSFVEMDRQYAEGSADEYLPSASTTLSSLEGVPLDTPSEVSHRLDLFMFENEEG